MHLLVSIRVCIGRADADMSGVRDSGFRVSGARPQTGATPGRGIGFSGAGDLATPASPRAQPMHSVLATPDFPGKITWQPWYNSADVEARDLLTPELEGRDAH